MSNEKQNLTKLKDVIFTDGKILSLDTTQEVLKVRFCDYARTAVNALIAEKFVNHYKSHKRRILRRFLNNSKMEFVEKKIRLIPPKGLKICLNLSPSVNFLVANLKPTCATSPANAIANTIKIMGSTNSATVIMNLLNNAGTLASVIFIEAELRRISFMKS